MLTVDEAQCLLRAGEICRGTVTVLRAGWDKAWLGSTLIHFRLGGR